MQVILKASNKSIIVDLYKDNISKIVNKEITVGEIVGCTVCTVKKRKPLYLTVTDIGHSYIGLQEGGEGTIYTLWL